LCPAASTHFSAGERQYGHYPQGAPKAGVTDVDRGVRGIRDRPSMHTKASHVGYSVGPALADEIKWGLLIP